MDNISQGLASLPQGLASLPQGLSSLPNELILLVFNFINLITDKRQFLRTCTLHNKITDQSMTNFENNYSIKHFKKISSYCMEKFTLELCHDKYFDMIPNSYIVEDNKIIGSALGAFYSEEPLYEKSNSLFDYCKYGFVMFRKSYIEYDNPNILELAKINGCDLNKICKYAAENGHLDILKWAYENTRGYVSPITFENVAINGHLHILKWFDEIGFVWSHNIFEGAAEAGHLEMLKWAKEKGYIWDENICVAAAINGHLDILKWARENGCDWDEMVTHHARIRGHIEVLNWAIENGCPD